MLSWGIVSQPRHRLVLPLVALLALGCGSDDDQPVPLDIPDGCNPLASEHDCLLPYPSDFFLVDDGSMPTGRRVVLPPATLISTKDGDLVDLLALHPSDGFSPGNQILALFPQGVDDSDLVGAADDLTASLGPDSPTVLLDAESGELILHLAEIDPRAKTDGRRALLIRPQVRLLDHHRYVVAIRGLCGKDGALLSPPEAFRRIRDGDDTSHPAVAPLAGRYDADVFAPLAEAGVARGELQLAWDFTTRSLENITGDMLSVRAQTIAYFASHTPAVTILSVEEQPEEHTHRRIEATVTAPLFLSDTDLGAMLHRDDGGQVSQNGTVEVPFTVLIPESIAALPPDGPPARLMQFGHGFFGGRDEVNGIIDQLADERGFVVVAADWWGMTHEDSIAITDDLMGDTGQAMRFTDRLHQGMANYIAVSYAAAGPLSSFPELQLGPTPLYDASQIYFYGISQGGILGGTYLALSPLIERGVLGVGGADLSFIMFRAGPFIGFLAFIAIQVPNELDQQKLVMLLQASFDRVDPLSYAPQVITEPLGDGPAERRLLMQIGIGDAGVPNLASHLHARALGVSHLQPAPRAITGLAEADAPLDGSAIVEFDFGIDPLPGIEAIPPTSDTEAHNGVRQLEVAKEQLDLFLRPGGTIDHTCDGVCDPD
ncbi:MAG: hypothetical protein DRI90_05250 [Deltaproteobacteria bacterium]|nr:MAG: hypothetical protein DRI90_05250 [Deltaproteobacteria bacterium]